MESNFVITFCEFQFYILPRTRVEAKKEKEINLD